MIEFLLDIWSKFHRKVTVSYCTVAHAIMKVAKQDILFMAWRLVAFCPTARAMSHLVCENMTTDVTRGRPVCSYRPRLPTSYAVCRQLAAIQWIRRLAEVGWQTDRWRLRRSNDLVV